GEPFGRVIIEGMSVGRPVIATRAGGVPEFVHDGVDGILVEPGDSRQLADVLLGLIDDPVRRQDLGRAAKFAVRKFSLQTHVEQITEIYERISRPERSDRAPSVVSARGAVDGQRS
ncbi:MAG: glycosyltransferase, partial [Myxococcales bacterium]